MIKYKAMTGAKHVNMEARMQLEHIKPLLRGMHCRSCGMDSLIDFYIDGDYHARMRINACCDPFRIRIREKLGMPI